MRTHLRWSLVAIALSCGPQTTDRTSAPIGPTGGTLMGPKGSTVVVPSGAVATDITVTAETATTPATPQDVDTVGDTLILGPEGQQFSAPVAVTLNVDLTRLPAGASLSDVVIFSAPVGSETYENLGGTPVGSDQVRATTTHFSKFVPGVEHKHEHDDAGTGGGAGGGAGGGSSAAGGGSNAAGGGSSAAGGGSSAAGGGTSAAGGGTSAAGGGTSAAGGGTSAVGGGTSSTGGGTSSAGGGTSAAGGGTSSTGGGTSSAGGGTNAAGGGTSAAGGGTSAAGGGTSAAGGGTGATGGGGAGGGSADAGTDAGVVYCAFQQFQTATSCTLMFAYTCQGESAQCAKDGGLCTCFRDGGTPSGTYDPASDNIVNLCAAPFQFGQLVQLGCGFP
jgi:hypothetical protein